MGVNAGLVAATGVCVLVFSCILIVVGVLTFLIKRQRSQLEFAPLEVIKQNHWMQQQQQQQFNSVQNSSSPRNSIDVAQARPFHLLEIKAATQEFKTKVGEGGFGPVYHGLLPQGTQIAVKVSAYDSNQGAAEFLNEVHLLSRVHHRNVVSLIGYCHESYAQILVYEYLSGGTLEDYIHGKKQVLSWKQRVGIALDAAKGIEYLHNGCSPTIIHRDLKSANILLTDKMLAKVADFGLSRLGPETGKSRVFTTVKGTSGYVDPEYYETQTLTTKSDVYSFGVVLLEIISGREAFSELHPHKQTMLCDWARGFLLERRIGKIVDPVLENDYHVESAWKMAELAMFCVEPRSVNRPTMSEVVQQLKEAMDTAERNAGIPIASLLPLSFPRAKGRNAMSEPCYKVRG